MTPIERLKALKLEHLKREYPSVPEYAIPSQKYTDTTANGLTRCVMDWLNLSGHMAERTSNEGRVIDNRKTYVDAIGQRKTIGEVKRIKSSGTVGTSDVKAVIRGRMVAIEIKIGKDRQSDAQKKYQAKVEAAGGVYIIVKNFSDFLSWYDIFISN